MNDHDAQRIAAAMHAARPDWPTASVLTLIRQRLIDRPRRDVFVALAWVASEADSHTPARVLETGPWWQAAGVEGATAPRPERVPRERRCSICSRSRDTCRGDDHEFVSAAQAIQAATAMTDELAAEVRQQIAAVERPAAVERSCEADERVEAARAALVTANPGLASPPLREREVTDA